MKPVKSDEPIKKWRCWYCDLDLLTEEVYFNRLHRSTVNLLKSPALGTWWGFSFWRRIPQAQLCPRAHHPSEVTDLGDDLIEFAFKGDEFGIEGVQLCKLHPYDPHVRFYRCDPEVEVCIVNGGEVVFDCRYSSVMPEEEKSGPGAENR